MRPSCTPSACTFASTDRAWASLSLIVGGAPAPTLTTTSETAVVPRTARSARPGMRAREAVIERGPVRAPFSLCHPSPAFQEGGRDERARPDDRHGDCRPAEDGSSPDEREQRRDEEQSGRVCAPVREGDDAQHPPE